MIGWRILLWVVLVLAAIGFLYLVRGILPPFIVSIVIAALLEPSIRRLRLRGMSRTWAVTLVFVLFFASVTALGIIVGPRVAGQIADLQQTVITVTQNLTRTDPNENFFLRWNPVVQERRQTQPARIDSILEPYRPTLDRFGLPSTQQRIVQEYVEPRRGDIAVLVQRGFAAFFGILQGIPTQLLYLMLIPILTFMMLMEMEDVKRSSPRWIPPSIRASTMALFEDIGNVFMRFLRGIATVVLLFTLAVTLLFILMGVPYPIVIGVVFGVLYLIPYIGNIISHLVLFLLVGLSGATGNFAFNTASPWIYATIVTLMFFAVAFTFDHLIYPQMVGSSVGLNGVVSMFVILSGAALFGLPGMILAFPLAGSVKVVLDRLLRVTSTTTEDLALPPVPLRHRATEAV